ncbi:hypothetical protein RB623_28080 [Mesorhizobium sp. LHD-90]|uniref:hypothetical protein n=1 Tax=Mesorhizobium sp. LHD-90 TaxID=3071414 RepID=UPI0027E194D0|nr:hypothetical protein [Mesorhizobium sp. LHD-90]MDQ6437929.1 hypothetical protein [Mesorhizobium sp. LHD-90]
MRLISSLLVAASLSFAAGTAMAACPDDTAAAGTDMNKTGAIAKDGTHAPLETPDSQAKAGNPVAKDGSNMPLAEQEGGGNKDLATSQQDVEAQQHGDKTAAATAEDEKCKE